MNSTIPPEGAACGGRVPLIGHPEVSYSEAIGSNLKTPGMINQAPT